MKANFTLPQNEIKATYNVPTNEIKATFKIDKYYSHSETFIYEQAIASDTWIITHNLNKYPSVTVVDSAGDEVISDVTYVDKNQCIVKFKASFKGKAYLN